MYAKYTFCIEDSQREYLLHEELQSLASTECKYPILKKAFIFSCLTGLRWSDIQKLTWSEIRDEQDNEGKAYSRVTFRQEKNRWLRISLHSRPRMEFLTFFGQILKRHYLYSVLNIVY